MAVTQLPIYNHTRQLIEDYMRVYEQIRNLHKYHIGGYVYDHALALPMLIKKADRADVNSRERLERLEDYIDELECVANGIRIAFETKVIGLKSHTRLSERIVMLQKESIGWKNKTEARISCAIRASE